MNIKEKFEDSAEDALKTLGISLLTFLIIFIVITIFYVGGAISLCLNYNSYIGTSGGLKVFYAILVFFFPSLYYPFYAWFLNPIKAIKNRNNNSSPRI